LSPGSKCVFFWQWIKAKSSRNPQDLRWKVILGSANKYSWQIVNFLFSELFLKMIHRLIVWTFTWNHDSILALPHWKIDLKICSLQFPYLFLCHFEWILFRTKINYFGSFLWSVFRPPWVSVDGNDTDFELFEMMLFDEIVNKSSDRIGLFV